MPNVNITLKLEQVPVLLPEELEGLSNPKGIVSSEVVLLR